MSEKKVHVETTSRKVGRGHDNDLRSPLIHPAQSLFVEMETD